MKVKDLLSVLPEYSTENFSLDQVLVEVKSVVADTQKVEEACVFVAIRGTKHDTHELLGSVVEKRPAAIVVMDRTKVPSSYTGVVLQVENSREALAHLASRFLGDPSRFLLMFGVTGTNGKTTTTYLMEHIFNTTGFSTGVIGTINHHLGEKVWETGTTTPGPLELHSRLKEMKEEGAKFVAMEVSSHALHQHRVDSVHFNTVLFTNLTQDHLDYHVTMQEYFLAKQRLFTDLLWQSDKVPQFAIINCDDYYGRRLRVAGYAGLWTYGQNKRADFRFKILNSNFSETHLDLVTPFGDFFAKIPLCGVHNVYNVVGVLAAAASLGIPIPYSLKALEKFQGVPGRLQPVPNTQNIHVFVDYAHSPDALENVLKTLTKIRANKQKPDQKADQKAGKKTDQKIITVFGCGGDRDKSKRSLMAAVVDQNSDTSIVTSDNPRTEDPMAIIHDVMAGFSKQKPRIEPDRRKAIQMAIAAAQPGDVVLIAGKGHEDYQIIGQEKINFSDFATAQEYLK